MQLQVTGQLIGMEPRAGGWVAVVIQDPNEQYPKKLSTKQPQLLGQAQQLMMQHVTAVYSESDSQNINPNSGLPYTNRNLTQLTLANGAAPQPAAPVFQPQPATTTNQPQSVTFTPQPQQPLPPTFTPTPAPVQPQPALTQRISEAERELRIHRQTASKVAATLLQYLDPEEQNLASHIRLSEQLVHYYTNGVNWQVPPPAPSPTPVGQPSGPSGITGGNTGQPTQEEQIKEAFPPAQGGAPPPTDDIPFAPSLF